MGTRDRWTLLLVVVALVISLAPAVALADSPPARASVAPTGSLAPLNPAFVQYQKDLAAGRLSASPGGSPYGLRPAPLDVSYLDLLAVPGVARAYPATYDLRTLNRVTSAKDQGPNGTCWVFATMSSLESCLLKNATTVYDFSEDNCVLTHGFDYVADGPYATGGFYQESTAYLARWSGPVYESEDPYYDNVTPAGLTPKKHIQQVFWLPGRGYLPGEDAGWTGIAKDAVKGAVTNYGGVWSTIHVGGETDQTTYFNDATDAWYYNGTGDTDHAVLIAGWDDGYARTNFAAGHQPPGNGAWIVKNSWGTGWGDNGFFHVSYYDTKFGDCLACFNNAESTSNYKGVYQYDKLGVVSCWGWGTTTGWFANTFTATSSNPLAAVSFYAMAPGTTYEVWAGSTLAAKAKKTSGTVTYAGYYTAKLPTPMALTNGQKFSVAVKVTTPGQNYGTPLELPMANYSSAATAAAGQSFISKDGSTWYDLTAQQGCAKGNVCLKAFTTAALTKTRYEETDTRLSYSTPWTSVSGTSYSGNSMRTRNASGSVTAKFTGTAATVIATKASTYGKMKVTLDGVASTVDLRSATTLYKQAVYTKSGLATTATHTLKLEWTGTTSGSGKTIDLDALDITGTLVQAPLPTVRYEETNTNLLYSTAWTPVSNAVYSGNSMRTRNASGSVTALFKGTGITVVATKAASYGKMKVVLDGTASTVDLRATSTAYKQPVYTKTGLTNTSHYLRIEWTGTTSGTGTTVNLDAVDVQGALVAYQTYQESDSKIAFTPAWTDVSNSSCSGGKMRTRNAAGSATATFTGTGISVIATKSPAYGKLRVILDYGTPTIVDLRATSTLYKQKVYTKSGLTYGGHTLRLEWTGSTSGTGTTVNLDALEVTGVLSQAPTRYEEDNTKLAYVGTWTSVSNSACSAGKMRTRNASGSVTATFTGTLVNVIAAKGAYGKIKITVDGTATTVDLAATTTAYQKRVYAKSLASAAHTLKLEWVSGTVNIDAIEIVGTLTQAPTTTAYQENNSKLRYLGTWSRPSVSGCSGGYQATTNAPGAVIINFTGPSVNLISTKGPTYGKMSITLDPQGTAPATSTVNLYATGNAYQQKVYTKTGLANAAHQLLVEWTGTKGATTGGTTINIDAFELPGGTLTQVPDYTGSLVGYWSTPVDPVLTDAYTFRANGTYTRLMYSESGDFLRGMLRDDGLYIAAGGKVLLFDALEDWTPASDDPSGTNQYTDVPIEDSLCPYRIVDSGGTLYVTDGSYESGPYYKQ